MITNYKSNSQGLRCAAAFSDPSLSGYMPRLDIRYSKVAAGPDERGGVPAS